ncbi:MAG: hypothetical protein Fur0024_1240 [Patescibacteria group bacterium]
MFEKILSFFGKKVGRKSFIDAFDNEGFNSIVVYKPYAKIPQKTKKRILKNYVDLIYIAVSTINKCILMQNLN